MNMNFKSLYIQMFDENSSYEYKALLNENHIPDEFEYLNKQKLQYNKKVYILSGEYDKKVLFRTKTVRLLIGLLCCRRCKIKA